MSEGRRIDVVERLAAVIRAVPDVRLLDHSRDSDHNRSVFTFVGDAAGVEAAALALIEQAYRDIDLRAHSGQHPRLGAVDVVPFVPLTGSTMDDCIAVARRVGRVVAERHRVPVYYYARAATRPERVRLPDIRRPQFEGLVSVIATSHAPDEGPAVVHPTAGAIVIGARPPLIAFNIELDSTDLRLARRIAREIRESSGGLPAVQALGLVLSAPSRVQVSMNLLDYSVTSLPEVWGAVESRAAAAGVRVLRGELVGLVPLEAALAAAAAALRLDGLPADRVVEARLLGR